MQFPDQPLQHGPTADTRRAFIACVVVYSIGNLTGWLAPQILFGAMHHFGASAAQGGLLTLVEGVTAGLLSMLLGAYPPKLTHRRLAIIGIGLFIAMNAVSPWMPGFSSLLGIRLIAGIADAILVFAGVSLVAMTSASPDRSYATMNVASSVYGAIILASLPLFLPHGTGLAYLPFSAAAGLLLAPLVLLLPKHTLPGRQPHADGPDGHAQVTPDSKAIFVVLLAIMIPQCFQSFSLFTFSPGIGARLGMSEAAINTALGGATLASVAGPFIAAVAARRFGRWWPSFVMAVLFFGSNLVLAHAMNENVFRICLIINLTAAYFFIPLLLAWSADIDSSGRFSSMIMGAMIVTASLSPAIAGAFVDHLGLGVLSGLVVVTGSLLLIMLVALRVLLARHARLLQTGEVAGAL